MIRIPKNSPRPAMPSGASEDRVHNHDAPVVIGVISKQIQRHALAAVIHLPPFGYRRATTLCRRTTNQGRLLRRSVPMLTPKANVLVQVNLRNAILQMKRKLLESRIALWGAADPITESLAILRDVETVSISLQRHRTGAPGSSTNLIRRLPRSRLLRLLFEFLYLFCISGFLHPLE